MANFLVKAYNVFLTNGQFSVQSL